MKKGNSKKVIFVPCYDGHIRTFHLVIKKMQSMIGWDPVVVCLNGIHSETLLNYSVTNGLPCKWVNFPVYTGPLAGGIVSKLSNGWRYYKFLRTAQQVIREIFDEVDPAILVTATDGFTDTHFLFEACHRRIPSLCLCSSITSAELAAEITAASQGNITHTIYRGLLKLAGLPVPVMPVGYADILCLWGRRHLENFLERGANPAQLAITGSPAHDLIYQQVNNSTPEEMSELRKSYGISGKKNIFLYCTQPIANDGLCTPQEQQSLTKKVVEACARFKDHVLVIKLHPRESMMQYEYLLRFPHVDNLYLFSEKDANLFDLIRIADVLITQSSSTGIDAMLFGKDIVIIDILTRSKDVMGYVAGKAALNVTDRDNLFDILYQLLNDEETKKNLAEGRQAFITSYIDRYDGQATSRVISFIEKILRDRGQ